jgi:predicted nucleic acid-binding Zn ribbon protein
MPHYKCTCCHHEFDHIPDDFDESPVLCDWCNAPATILEELTSLERLCKDLCKNNFHWY